MIIKALSVKLPWAEMIRNGDKRIEFRTWYRKYRGPLLIVASQHRRDPNGGKASCVVNVVSWRVASIVDDNEPGFKTIVPAQFQRSARVPGVYSIILGAVYPVDRIPIKGRLGLYDVFTQNLSIIEAVSKSNVANDQELPF